MCAVLVEQLVGQIGYCIRPCSISVCCVGGATGRADWLLHCGHLLEEKFAHLVIQVAFRADLTPIWGRSKFKDALMSYVVFS